MRRLIVIAVFILLIAIMTVLFVNSEFYENYKEELAEKKMQERLEAEEEEKKRFDALTEFMKYIETNDDVRITLIGDSITVGVGSEGHVETVGGRVVYEDAGKTYYEADDSGDSWANGLKRYFSEHYEHVEVINNGISGMTTKYALNHKEGWIGHDLDVVIVQLGTNDRWACSSVQEFEKYYVELLNYIDAESNRMIVLAPPPTLNDDSPDYNFGMDDVNQVVLRVARENGYVVFSQYDAIDAYAKENGVPLEELLQKDGTHPQDAGYQVMYLQLYEFLGLGGYR